MNVPAEVTETFSLAPFARMLLFHRTRESTWKPEAQLLLLERTVLPPIQAPRPLFLEQTFASLPEKFLGDVIFEWQEAKREWGVRAMLRSAADIAEARRIGPACIPVKNLVSEGPVPLL